MSSRGIFLFNLTWELSLLSPLCVYAKVFLDGEQLHRDRCWGVCHSAPHWLLSPDLGQAFSLLSILPTSEFIQPSVT